MQNFAKADFRSMGVLSSSLTCLCQKDSSRMMFTFSTQPNTLDCNVLQDQKLSSIFVVLHRRVSPNLRFCNLCLLESAGKGIVS